MEIEAPLWCARGERSDDTGAPPDRAPDIERRGMMRKAALGAGLAASGGLGAVWLALMESPAGAAPADVQMLQTAASIETLAISTYTSALALKVVGGAKANALFKLFVQKTIVDHKDHLAAFNAGAVRLGGKAQRLPDPVLNSIVETAKPNLKTASDVVGLVIQLEAIAQQTYVANTSAVSDSGARKLFAGIMGVEAQHATMLLVMKAMFVGSPDLATLPPDLTKLPATIGSIGFPDPVSKVEQARPAAEGAVQ